MNLAGGAEPDVNIRQTNPDETDPRPHHVTAVEARDTVVTLRAGR